MSQDSNPSAGQPHDPSAQPSQPSIQLTQNWTLEHSVFISLHHNLGICPSAIKGRFFDWFPHILPVQGVAKADWTTEMIMMRKAEVERRIRLLKDRGHDKDKVKKLAMGYAWGREAAEELPDRWEAMDDEGGNEGGVRLSEDRVS